MTGPRSIDLHHVLVPLKKPIRHASFERTASDNFVVRVTLADGTRGFGEGIPRPYVTGETIESAFASLEGFDLPPLIGEPRDFAEAVRRIAALTLPEAEADPRGMAGNSARCALELALLDAYGRKFDEPVGRAARLGEAIPEGLNAEPSEVRYSGAITAESPRSEAISAWKMRLYGFSQVKVKVGVPGQEDADRLRRIRRILGLGVDLRIDANEAWSADEVLDRVEPLRESRPSVLEQPVPHAQVDALAEIRPRMDGILLMLDESLCGYPDALRAVERRTTDLFNVRLSKCGGLFPSLRIMALARRVGLGLQLGCHPGESGLLSAAGRHLAGVVKGLSYVEGSYDRHVLASNLILEDITFRYGGRAKPLRGSGLGVTVDPAALERMTRKHREVRYD